MRWPDVFRQREVESTRLAQDLYRLLREPPIKEVFERLEERARRRVEALSPGDSAFDGALSRWKAIVDLRRECVLIASVEKKKQQENTE